MKAINKFFYALLAFATVGMVACSEDATHEPGPAELEGCYGVYFPEASVLESQGPMGETSLDPSEPTTFTYYAYRENTEGEITVPVEINSTLDAEGNPMYSVEPIVFLDGEDVAEFTVTLSDKAEVGVPYSLTVSVANDPQFVKQYDTANATMFSVTINRVKWIEVGQCLFVEDMVSAWYDLAVPPYEVKVEVRADSINEAAFEAALAGTGDDSGLAGIYRMVNPYEIWGQIGGITTFDANVLIYVLDASRVYIPFQKVGITINDGAGVNDVTILSEAGYELGNDTPIEDIKPEQWGYVRNGKIGFPVDMLLGNPGGSASPTSLYYANRNGLWSLTLSPALGVYELAMPNAEEDGDFSFAEVELPEGALFYSESQAAVYGPVLEKGRCEVSTKDADRIFYKEYGLLYRLPDLYKAGYPIYFAALEDGTVTLPKAYLNQATGLVQNGYEVMIAIDAEQSKFDPATGELSLVAEFYVGTGEEAVTYGNFREVISVTAPEFPVAPALDLKNDFSYTDLFTAPMESDFQQAEFDATLQKGVSYAEGVEAFEAAWGKAYCLPNLYADGYNIYFTADAEGAVSVPAGYELQPTGQYIYGEAAYVKVVNGTCTDKSVTLNVKICNIEGKELLPAACTETMVSYTWLDVATGSWYANISQTPFAGLTLQNAEGTNIYRVLDFMGVAGYNFTFTWDSTTNLCEVSGYNDTGIAAADLGVNAPGNIAFVDEKTMWNTNGYPDDTWESLKEDYGVSVQPYYDAEELTFVFRVAYFLPEAGGALTFTTQSGEKTQFVNEYFVLDAAPAVTTWENVAVGTFTHTTDFYAPAEYLPYPEANLTLQRYGKTNKYKIVGVAEGQYNIEFTYDETTGALEVPVKGTGLGTTVTEGAIEASYMDWWGFVQVFEMTDGGGNPLTKEVVYATYPNSYDATSKTYSFYLAYADVQYGYVFTSVNEGYPTLHTFQITGDVPAQTASVASATTQSLKLNCVKKFNVPANKFKSLNVRVAKVSELKHNGIAPQQARTLKSATPVKRQTMFLAR